MPKKGGANKKMKKYPRILDYLEAHHPNVYEVIEDLAMHGNLTPRRGGSITFLLPDTAYLKEIKKVAESDSAEDATDMVSSLILLDLFTKPEDFHAKQDDVPNLLGKRVVIKQVTPNKVLIEDGELTLDTKFQPFSRQGNVKRGNMAVWNLKGKVEYVKAPKSEMKYLKQGKVGKGVKILGGDQSSESKLSEIKAKVLEEKFKALREGTIGSEGGKHCPLLGAVACVLRVYSDPGETEFHEEYRRARALLTGNPFVDFHLLFCNPLVFESGKVVEAYEKGVNINKNVDTYLNVLGDFSHPALKQSTALMFKSREELEKLQKLRDRARDELMAQVSNTFAKKIKECYAETDRENSLGGASPVWPEGLIGVFRQHPDLHLAIDEFKHNAFNAYEAACQSGPGNADKEKAWREAVALVEESYRPLGPKSSQIAKQDLLTEGSSLYTLVLDFWKTWGLHLPCLPEGSCPGRTYYGSSESQDQYSRELVDMDSGIIEDLKSYDNCPMCVSQKAIAEVKAYMRSHGGKLPEALAA